MKYKVTLELKRQRRDIRLTPEPVIERFAKLCHTVLDDYMWFDPCPEDFERDGLQIAWKSPFYVNPPGSLNKEFASKFIETPGYGAFAAFNWDHSTEFTQQLLAASDTLLLFNYRWKCEGPDAITGEWREHEVARCNGMFFKGFQENDVVYAFENCGKVISL